MNVFIIVDGRVHSTEDSGNSKHKKIKHKYSKNKEIIMDRPVNVLIVNFKLNKGEKFISLEISFILLQFYCLPDKTLISHSANQGPIILYLSP